MSRVQMKVRWAVGVILLVAACSNTRVSRCVRADMRLVVGLLSLVFLAACSESAGVGLPSASVSSSTASPSSCRLPFTDFSATGFISYPDGIFKADATAATQSDPSRPGLVRTVALPALYGGGGSGQETYDWRFSRWLPVPRDLVFSDGSHYAYSELIPNPASQGLGGPPPLGTLVHVVDVATGKDDIAYRSADVLSATAVRAEGIYLTQPAVLADTAVPFYLWLVDLATRSGHKVLGGMPVGPGTTALSEGTLWIMATDPNNSKGAPRLVRVNLSDGRQSTWFEPSSGFVSLLGLDNVGRPVVSTFSGVNGDPGKTWVFTAAATQQAIADQGFTGTAIADRQGLWLTGNGIYIYPAGGPVKKASGQTGGSLLGTCG